MYRNFKVYPESVGMQGHTRAIDKDVLDDTAYSLVVSRYMHLNPVRTEEAVNLSLDTRRKMLESFN